jgi:hypothetical protein
VKARLRCIAAALTAALLSVPAVADLAAANGAYGQLLIRYVTPRGVRYDAWRTNGADIKKLSEIVMVYRSTEPASLTPEERKALYINLYNAKILETVIMSNPKSSIKELSIFDKKTLSFDGKSISLNDLEKRLRSEYKDPRVHFAVNCASKSCPPIRSTPYDAARLDAELDDAARAYLTSPQAVVVRAGRGKPTIVASRIFDWYADDFKASGGPLAFIAKYGPPDAADAIAGGRASLEFAEYDWSLNAAK